MAAFFDEPPVYDGLTEKSQDLMSDLWVAWISTFGQTLAGYLSPYGVFIPQLTTVQRDSIQSPQLGQFIYNTTTNELQVWQVKPSAAAAWHVITTTP